MSSEVVGESRRYFSLLEANSILPRIEYYLSEMAKIQRTVNNLIAKAVDVGFEIDEDVDFDDWIADDLISRNLKRRMIELSEEYVEFVEKIHSMGAILEDADQGMVKLYSWQDGEEICYSWQYGEGRISYWHKAAEDYIARRPIKRKSSQRISSQILH